MYDEKTLCIKFFNAVEAVKRKKEMHIHEEMKK